MSCCHVLCLTVAVWLGIGRMFDITIRRQPYRGTRVHTRPITGAYHMQKSHRGTGACHGGSDCTYITICDIITRVQHERERESSAGGGVQL